jgi:hypothetical protein
LRLAAKEVPYKQRRQTGEIAFDSLIKIAIALGMENDFDLLFAKKQFSSLRELIKVTGNASQYSVSNKLVS